MNAEELTQRLHAALRAEFEGCGGDNTDLDDFGWLNDDDPRNVQIDGWVRLDHVAQRILGEEVSGR